MIKIDKSRSLPHEGRFFYRNPHQSIIKLRRLFCANGIPGKNSGCVACIHGALCVYILNMGVFSDAQEQQPNKQTLRSF